MKKMNRSLVVSSLVCLLPVLVGLLFYGRLPDRIPIHWDSAGEVDNYAAKAFVVFVMPVLFCVLNLLVRTVVQNDPKRANASPAIRAIGFWIIPAISMVCCTVSFLAGMGVGVDVPLCLMGLLGFILILLGNYMPKCKQNYAIGIRLPWTLDDPENWNKTHHMAGYLWIVGGMAMILGAFLKLWWLQICIILLIALVPCVYSFLLYKRSGKQGR